MAACEFKRVLTVFHVPKQEMYFYSNAPYISSEGVALITLPSVASEFASPLGTSHKYANVFNPDEN